MRTTIVRHPLGDQVYLQLLQRIERGDLPTGSKLRDAAIASELGVSRTPVREALVRLAREGVLSAEPGRGFRLPPMSPAELRDIGSILAALFISLLKAYASLVVSPSQAVIVSFVVLILTLLFRPTGLFVPTPK